MSVRTVLLGVLLVSLAACGGGGGGSGGGGSDRAPRITGLSETSSTPFGLVTVTGEGFDTGAQTYVRFASADGSYTVSVPAVGVTATAVTAAVPPFLASTGQPGSGTVSVRVVQAAAGGELQSPPWEGFQIHELPSTGLPAGTVTLDFALAVTGLAGELEAEITGTVLDTAGVRAGLAQLRQAYGDLAGQVQAVMDGSAQSFDLGTLGGVALTVGLPQLSDADRMTIAILGGTVDAQLARVAVPGDLVRQGARGAVPALLLPQAQRALASASDEMTACLLSGERAPGGCSREKMRMAFGGIADSTRRALQVTAGSAGVVLGVMTLGGAPAMATALPSANLMYVQLVGGSGLIAVGGVLQQTTGEARVIVQQGVKTFDGFLKGMVETFLGAFVPATEKFLAVKNILEGGADLLDAFGVAVVNPEPPGGGTGFATYSGSFTGTTVEVSSFATLTYEIIGAVSATLEGGAGTMIDPYRGTLVVEGTVFVDCTPNLQGVTCENTSAPFLVEGPLGGLSGMIEGWAGGDSPAESPVLLSGGALSGDWLNGELSFDVGCYWECAQPIVKTVSMARMP